MSETTSQITGDSIVCSTVCSGAEKKNIKAPRHWPFWGESAGAFPSQRANYAGNVSHLMTSSYCMDFVERVCTKTAICCYSNLWTGFYPSAGLESYCRTGPSGVCQTCGMHISTDGRIFSVQSSMGLSRPEFGQRRGHLPPWWRRQMEKFSALLAVCAGNSPVPGEFPTQRPVTRRFDVFFDLRLNNRLSKQWWGWWNENLSRSLWRHRNAIWHQWSPDCGTPYAYLRNHVIDLLN